MRLFTGIDLPAEVVDNLARLVDRLRPLARVNWSRVENLHITTKFIGEWPEERLEELDAALRTVPARRPIPIAVRGLGWFPNSQAPRVFWAGVEGGAALAALAADTDRATASLGIEPEQRRFAPHLTLARIRDAAPLDRLRQAAAAGSSKEFGAFPADRFFLYLSERGAGGARYTRLEEFGFNRP